MTISIHVTDHSFDAEVLKCDIPVLADFWAEWCVPCKTVDRYLDEVAKIYPADQLKMVKVDIEANPIITSKYSVLNLPTLILFKNGQPVEHLVGAVTKDKIRDKVGPYVGR